RAWNSAWIQLGAGCLLLLGVTLLVTIGILRLVSNRTKSSGVTETKSDIYESVFQVVLTTDHVLNNNHQPFVIKNPHDIADELTRYLHGKQLHVISGSFRNDYDSQRTNCTDALHGNVLDLYVLPSYARRCVSGQDSKCKTRLVNHLHYIFRRLLTVPLTVQLNDNYTNNINVKLCDVELVDDHLNQSVARNISVRRKITKPLAPAESSMRIEQLNRTQNDSYATSRQFLCALSLNKIGLVQMDGDDNSSIQDDIRSFINNGQYRRAFILTVFEDSVHKLHVQMACGEYLGERSSDSPCSNSLSVHLWIDFNSNGYDEEESRLLQRSWLTTEMSTGTYDLDVYIPAIDDRTIRAGQYTMKITVMPSHDYQSKCGTVDYSERKDYTLNIVRKPRHIDTELSPYVYMNPLCASDFREITRVLMAGENGTEIRDDVPRNSSMNSNQNEHNLQLILYEHTIYLLRVQLNCSSQQQTQLTGTGCNSAQDINVFIDMNDDGRYDSFEIGAPHRWPIASYLPDGVVDLQVHIPYIDSRYVTSRQHQMKIVVTPSDRYLRICGDIDYIESRTYYVNIISKTASIPPNIHALTNVAHENITCTPQVSKIILVVMDDEHGSQIRDDPSTNAVLGPHDEHQQHPSIMLREGITYLLRLQFECAVHQDPHSAGNNCDLPYDLSVWIDSDDNGEYEEWERATPYRWPSTSYLPKSVYDLQIVVPIVDGIKVKSGPHRMKLLATLNEQHRRKCNMHDYQELRYYAVNIISHAPLSNDLGGLSLGLSDHVCTQSYGRIVLVLMAGERGTEIRDQTPNNTIIDRYQNRHHMAVTLYENTDYRIRIQLDCEAMSNRGPLRSDCNLALAVNVLIDQNNDRRYDKTETVTPHHWPLRSSAPLGLYDYGIRTPVSANEYYRRPNERHLMRIVVKPSDEQITKCGHTDYAEFREYSLNIISRTTIYD
ncbi:unnamed protein product, partial [Adineta ricciae]